ncbi:MAG: uracil-DNA glycosylase [Thermoplasmata archaeon]|nr:MAG: uracil-DNA glycosylase [Thermoplasmata archaeon]
MDKLAKLNKTILKCTKCELCESRINAVPGEGAKNAEVILIGEAPGKNEDEEGRPFVGRAGKTLDEVLAELSIPRENLYITNILKCRPPKNRVPKKPEVEACIDYLFKQIELIQPQIIVTLGQSALKTLTGLKGNLRDFHGNKYEFNNYPVLVTYHPAAVVYNRNLKSELVNDLKNIKSIIEK